MVIMRMNGEWQLEDLGAFVELVEIYDATGKFLGLFVPANMERGKELYAQGDALHDPAETERSLNEDPSPRLLSEVIAELKAQYPVDEPARVSAGPASPETQQCGTR
jgi:hypothetical protein